MASDRVGTDWRRILAAAARLAGMYVIGVLGLLLPFMLLPFAGPPFFLDLAAFGVLAGIPFALAFILLAAARRAGLVVFWALLAALWGAVLFAHDLPIDLLIAFVGWSVLALPLHLLTAVGIPAKLHLCVARVRLSVSSLATIVWILVLAPAIAVLYWSPRLMHPEPSEVFRFAGEIAPFFWGPAPFVLIALSVAHAWAGTRPTSHAARGTNDVMSARGRALLALTALGIALDGVVHVTTATRPIPRSPARAVTVHGPAPPHGMRILRPDMSTLDAMPCLESRNADSTHHAGLPGLGHSPCAIASVETSAPNPASNRSLGLW